MYMQWKCAKGGLFVCMCVPAARDIKIVKRLEDTEVMEKESASFVCEISHDEVDCQWYKGSSKLKVGDNIRMREEGGSYFLVVLHCSMYSKRCSLSVG